MKKKKYYLYAFLISFFIASFAIVPYIIKGNGILTLWGDFNTQQIPFGIYVNKMIKSSNYIYDWCNQYGNSFLESFSFYNLGSVFYWITLLFEPDFYPYLIGPMLIVKFAVAGLTSFIYINTFCKDEKCALIGSVLYAFSGFQITNLMFNHFHDVVALFPLLLYSLDNLILKKKRGIFCLILALLAVTNYFFFVGECVFLVIYFICNILSKRYKLTKKIFFNLLIEIGIGLLISGFLLYPSIFNILTNTRVNMLWDFKSLILYEDLSYYIDLFKAIILPPDLMFSRSFIIVFNYKSVELYLPFVSILFVVPFIKNNKKSFLTYILLILTICMFIPFFNSSFVGFNNVYYARWFYILTLVMSICTSISLEKGYSIKSGIISYFILFLLFILLLFIYKLFIKQTILLNYSMIIINMFIVLISFVLLLFIIKFAKKQLLFLILVSLFSFILLDLNIYNCIYYTKDSFLFNDYKNNYLNIDKKIILDDSDNYRIYANQNNISYVMNKPAIFSFNSVIDENNLKFYNTIAKEKYIDYYKTRLILDLDQIYVNTFLSNKYLISRDIKMDESDLSNLKNSNKVNVKEDSSNSIYEVYYQDNDFTVYKNKYFLGFGLLYNTYIEDGIFNNLDYDSRNSAYLKGVILNKKQIKDYSSFIKKVNVDDLGKNELNDLENDVYNLKDNGETFFSKTNKGFKVKVSSKDNCLLLLTFPYDEGWSAYSDKKEINIDEVSNGFMAIKVNKGVNEVEFIYETKGQRIGIVMSVLGITLYLCYLLFTKNVKYLINIY